MDLFILVNNKPTNSNKVWLNLVNVSEIKAAVKKLKQTNWLYKTVDEDSVDELAKEIIEVVSSMSSTMLEKASDEDNSGLHSYTIMDMNDKLSTEKDLEQYKLLNVKEDPLFPTLFPDGKYGENLPRVLKLSNSEYIKSRIWNDDSHFRKDPQYIFYLLKQGPQLWHLQHAKDSIVFGLLNKMKAGDDQLEASLSTMFQNMRGTKQFWFKRRGELKCMLRTDK